MDTASQVKASLEFEEMLHQQKLLDEYQRLGSPYPQVSDLVPFVLVVLALLLCHQFALVDAQTLLIVQWLRVLISWCVVLPWRSEEEPTGGWTCCCGSCSISWQPDSKMALIVRFLQLRLNHHRRQ